MAASLEPAQPDTALKYFNDRSLSDCTLIIEQDNPAAEEAEQQDEHVSKKPRTNTSATMVNSIHASKLLLAAHSEYFKCDSSSF